MQRLKWVDVAKGIAMLSVILGHFGIDGINRVVYPYHIIIFFLLSGYTMREHELDSAYLRKKFVGLMKPYFVTVFFVTLMDVINTLFYLKDRTIQTISAVLRNDIIRGFAASGDVRKILTAEVTSRIGAVWFLPAMFFAVVFAQFIIQKWYKGRYLVSLFLMIIAQATGEQFWLPFSIQSAMMAVIFVVLGYDCKRNGSLEKLTVAHYVAAGAVFLAGVWLRYGCYFVTAQMTELALSSITGLSGCLLVYLLSNKLQNNRFLQFIGKHSLIFLCVHLFAMETMPGYFNWLCSVLSPFDGERWSTFVRVSLEVVCVLAMSYVVVRIIQYLKTRKEAQRQPVAAQNRVVGIDIEKAILIVLMLIGHAPIDGGLRGIIYSFHMVAFVLLSGYFYKRKDILIQLKKDFWNLIVPCIVAIMGCQLIHVVSGDAQQMAWGDILLAMSFSGKLFPDAGSIGPIWFVFMLFCTKQLYGFVRQVCPKYVDAAVVLITLAGIALGNTGFWLPWSVDCALYSVGIYHIGCKMREYSVFETVKERPYLYFALSSVWAYAVFKGGMEVAIRRYSPYMIACAGAVCATIVLYMLSDYIGSALLPEWIKRTLSEIGKSTIWILLVHTLLEATWLAPVVQNVFSPQGIYYLAVMIALEVTIGVVLSKIWSHLSFTRKQSVGSSQKA